MFNESIGFYIYWFAIFLIVQLGAFIIAVLIRTMSNPEKSLLNSAISIILGPIRFFRLGPYRTGDITVKNALSIAKKKSKLSDFGDDTKPNFEDAYNLIMDSKEYRAQKVTNIGYIFASNELILSFVRRLKFVQYMKENADLLQLAVPSPVFVMGLPRTGTTLMHRLLSLDPNVRAPLLWELLNPVPTVPGSATEEDFKADRVKRFKYIRGLIASRKKLGDSSVDHIHEIEADLPEECLLALSDEMPLHMQHLYANYMNADRFMTIDAQKAYDWYRKVLQLLTYQLKQERASPRSWMLKCPLHLFYIKNIQRAFPDAKIIWTHRHPISAVPSMCSLIESFHKFYYEKEGRDNHELGRRMSLFTGKKLLEAAQDIEDSGLDNHHVVYNELTEDPKKAVKAIYAKFNWKYTEEYDKILDDYLLQNERERAAIKNQRSKTHVLHSYSPEEYGLTSDELSNGAFQAYVEKFNVPMSKN